MFIIHYFISKCNPFPITKKTAVPKYSSFSFVSVVKLQLSGAVVGLKVFIAAWSAAAGQDNILNLQLNYIDHCLHVFHSLHLLLLVINFNI